MKPPQSFSLRRSAAGLAFLLLLACAATAGAQRLRVVASNLSSGNFQNYDPGHGARILEGLDPDIVLMQEFNYGSNSDSACRLFVDATFGDSFSFSREIGAQIPNGIISRYPILASGEWDDVQVSNRDFAWARIDVPGDRDLWAISVHFLTANATVRNSEAAALTAFVKVNVPASDFLVIGGDFNSDNRSESQFTTLAQVVNTAAPHPVDGKGNGGTNASRAKPYDSVFADADLRALQVPVVIGASTFANGLVVDTRVYIPLADLSPAQIGDSAASQMQHMAVVKDFLLPAPPPADSPAIPLLSHTIRTEAPARVSLTFQSTPAAVYEIQASSDMAAGSWTRLGEINASTNATTAVIVPDAPASGEVNDAALGVAGRRFYRVARK